MPELTTTTPALKGVERAAVVLMALGEDHAAEILRHLDPRELHKIGVSMTNLTRINRDQISEIVHTFNQEINEQSSLVLDSENYIRGVLIRALGREKAKGVLDHIFDNETGSGVEEVRDAWAGSDRRVWRSRRRATLGLGEQRDELACRSGQARCDPHASGDPARGDSRCVDSRRPVVATPRARDGERARAGTGAAAGVVGVSAARLQVARLGNRSNDVTPGRRLGVVDHSMRGGEGRCFQ